MKEGPSLLTGKKIDKEFNVLFLYKNKMKLCFYKKKSPVMTERKAKK